MSKRHNKKKGMSRKFGVNLWGEEGGVFSKRNYPPGEHGLNKFSRSEGRGADFAIQLKAKQMIKGYYCNITERQFKSIYKEAFRRRGDTGQSLVGLLESRLDSFVYRTKFAPTMHAARQLVSHKHFLVNGVVTNVPSYRLKAGDSVQLRSKSSKIPLILNSFASLERKVPKYIDIDTSSVVNLAKFVKMPELSEIPYAVEMKPHLVTEFYSR